ncbi:MAG: O-acetyl-ADP-ribose deacetylase [Bacteroidota bacterium]
MSHTRIQILQGDITTIEVAVIVNAANSSLLGGGGVDGAIHRAGGPAILEECMDIRARQGGCATGQAVITTAGRLPAQQVIHTVGPVWQKQRKEEMEQLLANCYRNSLQLAVEHGLDTVAFPNISTGIYRFPKQRAAEVAIRTVKQFLAQDSTIKMVSFVCYDQINYQIYSDIMNL